MVALLVTSCGAGTPTPVEPEELSASKAGGLYLSAVCPVNDEWDRVDLEIDRLRLALGRGDGSPKNAARALVDLADASARSEKALAPKGQAWPTAAEPAIEAVRDTLRADRAQALRVAKLPADELVAYSWQGSAEIATAASDARSALGLPANALDACVQWGEQQAERDQQSNSERKQEQSSKTQQSD